MKPVSTSVGDDDLLRPILTAADDLGGIDRPWNPWSLVFLVFFAGPLVGGALAAWNFKRLGEPGRFAPAMTAFALTWVATIVVAALAHEPERTVSRNVNVRVKRTDVVVPEGSVGLGGGAGVQPEVPEREVARDWRRLTRVLGLVPALVVARLQRRRFRVFEGTGGDAASLWKPGLLAFGISIVVSLVLVPPIAAWVLHLRGAL